MRGSHHSAMFTRKVSIGKLQLGNKPLRSTPFDRFKVRVYQGYISGENDGPRVEIATCRVRSEVNGLANMDGPKVDSLEPKWTVISGKVVGCGRKRAVF